MYSIQQFFLKLYLSFSANRTKETTKENTEISQVPIFFYKMFRNTSVTEVPDVPTVDVALQTDISFPSQFPSTVPSTDIPAVDVDVPSFADACRRKNQSPSRIKWYEKQNARIAKQRAAKAAKDRQLSTLQSTL